MAVNHNESKLFKFVIVSDKPKPSKNKIKEKPSKDKDNMSTKQSTSPPNDNEKPINDINEKEISQETNKQQTVPELNVDTPGEGDSKKEQKQENESSRNNLSIKIPSKGAPQLVSSPSQLGAKTPEPEPVSPSKSPNIFKKLGNMIRNTPEDGSASSTASEKEETSTSEQKITDNATSESIPEDKSSTENTANVEESEVNDENQKDKKDKSGKTRMSSIVNMKMFITRTSSTLVEKLREEFDNLDKKIYPEIEVDPNWVTDDKLAREQLLENKDLSPVPSTTTQTIQTTQSVLADNLKDLNERKERLENLGQKSEELSSNAASFAEAAARLAKKQETKSKFWNIF